MIGSILFVPYGFIQEGTLFKGHWRAGKVKSGLQKGARALGAFLSGS